MKVLTISLHFMCRKLIKEERNFTARQIQNQKTMVIIILRNVNM